jgi:hypothetical protein
LASTAALIRLFSVVRKINLGAVNISTCIFKQAQVVFTNIRFSQRPQNRQILSCAAAVESLELTIDIVDPAAVVAAT